MHIIPSLGSGGAEAMLTKIVEKNNDKNIEMVVLTFLEFDYFYERIVNSGVTVYSLGLNKKNFKFKSVIKILSIYKIIINEKPDIIQSWMYHSDLVAAFLKLLFPSIKVVWNIRHSKLIVGVDKRSTILLAKLLSKLSFIPNQIICGSQAALDTHLELGYKEKKLKVIANGFDTELFSPNLKVKKIIKNELGIPDDHALIGYIGREKKVKNQIQLLEAFNIISKENPSLHLLLLGKGIKEKYKNHSLVNENVYLIEESNKVHKYMQALDLFVLTSLSEGFPNVVGEAMACEVPTISNNVGDSAKIIGDERLITEPSSVEDIVKKITWWQELGNNEKEYLKVSARKRIKEMYSIEIIVKEYINLYKKLNTY